MDEKKKFCIWLENIIEMFKEGGFRICERISEILYF